MHRRGKRKMLLAVAWLAGVAAVAGAQQVITLEGAEMAGISGFRAYWDKPVVLTEAGATRMSDHGAHGKGLVADWSTAGPGAPVFDAIHRSLLVRFPGAAEALAAELRKGSTIAKVELVLPFVDAEFYPMDYRLPDGMSFLGDLWVRLPPRWHAVAWALRQPWRADPVMGPTYNASVNGRRYWGRFGAQDTTADRYPAQFGPAEVSVQNPEGRMDVTALLADPAYGRTLAERLRALADQGFLVRKWETYDALFNHGGYEYGGAPGHRGIRIQTPRLVVTLKPGQADVGDLPAAADAGALPPAGQPTALNFGAAEVQAFIAKHAIRQSPGMPDWQWARVQELLALGGGNAFATTPEQYNAWLDDLLSTPYRMFRGHHTPLMAEHYLLYGDAMPEPVREHLRRYFEGWLMPGRPYTDLAHNQWGIWIKPENSYHARTGDWRGNHSFYRDSYTRFMSTMNFNHLAATGALLGGSIIGDPCALDDGRHGLEVILGRLWCWYDGTTQESIDHYYLGLTLLAQKSFADLGPTALDRMLGRSILTKTVEELAACYHPALRRFVSTSGRTGIAYLFGINEGPSAILHTLSPKGAMHDLQNPDRRGMPLAGHDLPPGQVAAQALRGPWAPLWLADIVDGKPLPYEMTATYKVWGGHREKPLWKRTFLGTHYGLASLDIHVGNETVPFMAQWRRSAGVAAENFQDVGTLLARYGINRTEFYDSLYHGTDKANPNGSVGTQGGSLATLQWRSKAIVLGSPYRDLQFPGGRPVPEQITSLQTSLALANYQATPTWKLYIDEQPVTTVPVRAQSTSRIFVEDGVSYVALIPIPATDLGRDAEIEISDGGAPVKMQGGGELAPTYVVNNYNFCRPNAPWAKANVNGAAVTRAYGGFVVELGDAAEFGSFAAFRKHIATAKLDVQWDDAAGVVKVSYTSGQDTLEAGYRPEYEGDRVPSDQCFVYRRVNGQWPYLPAGLERDTTLSSMGTTGLLMKSGATLAHQPGRMAYLLTDPTGGNYVFANPLPDPQYMAMRTPGEAGLGLAADGRLGLFQAAVNVKTNTVDVQYAVKDGQTGDEMATALLISAPGEVPAVTVNGQAAAKPVRLDVPAGRAATVWAVPLLPGGDLDATTLAARCEKSVPLATAALRNAATTDARLRYDTGEHYILTEPRIGAYRFWRQWPNESFLAAELPGGVAVRCDGRLALQALTVAPAEGRIEVDYAPYLQVDKDGNPIKGRAKALLVFGLEKPPVVVLHGKPFAGTPEKVELGGATAWAVPLFDEAPAAVKTGLAERYAATLKALEGK